MKRMMSGVQTFIWLGLLLGFTIGLIGLFSAVSRSQTSSPAPQATLPGADISATHRPELTQVPPTPPVAIPTLPAQARSAGVLFESAGELNWLPVDEHGKALTAVSRIPIDFATKSKITQLYPAPDGTQIVYRVETEGPADSEGTWALYAFSPPTGAPRQIMSMADGISAGKIFGWLPNSRQLVYWTESGIGLLDVNSGKKTVIARPEEWANLPYFPQVDGVAFSPDGTRMIVSYTLTGQIWEVWNIHLDSSEKQSLFKTDYPVFAFAWSPNSQYIAFVGQGLEVITPDGKDRKVLSQDFSVGWGFEPTWSPDSHLIAFTAAEASPEGLFKGHRVRLADPTTGKEYNLLSDSLGGEVEPVWSSDSKRLIFLSNRSGVSEIWEASFDGAELQHLTFDDKPKRWPPVLLPALGR